MFLSNLKTLRLSSVQKGLDIMPFYRKGAFRRHSIESGQFHDEWLIAVSAHLRRSFAVLISAFFRN
jgi:hypothetical protein